MSVKISEIAELDVYSSNPVMLENMYKYWWQLFGAKGFRARDHAVPALDGDGSNMVLVAGEKQLYRGYIGGLDVVGNKERGSKRAAAEPLRTYVAKRNRETGQMRLVEVVSCQLSHVCHDSPRGRQTTTAALDEKTLRMMRQKFDSKTHLANLQRMYGNKVDLNVIQEKLQRMITECALKVDDGAAFANDRPQGDGAEDDKMMLQPAAEIRAKSNLLATTLCDLYSAESLIGSNVLLKLTEPAKQLLQTPPEELSMGNEYLENRVKALMQSEDVGSESSLQKAGVCLFMDVLTRMFRRKMSRTIGQKGNVSPFTDVLNQPIRKQFLELQLQGNGTRLVITKNTETKALLYYLALVLALEELEEVPAKVLYQSLQMNKMELIKYALLIGAKFNQRSQTFQLVEMPKMKTEAEEIKQAITQSVKKR
ncbi:uncharacterized protein LOC131293205 [Anopheles ziemanni]|uniref:uncharacterized protein LOC131263395 n=1 Tax=Anopheles coustani TaxID=139045 RepID=UPI00265A55AA|nr:uncharacterized protein LOC131263395 [Anopheles coustani]XP_058177268.1 uncharacterized protein LOC131293205 [Anopheles ziemanni]